MRIYTRLSIKGGDLGQTNVYFNLHPNARGRQVDAALYPPEEVNAILPTQENASVEGTKIRKGGLLGKMAKINPIAINAKKCPPIPEDIDLIYNYSTFLDESPKPYLLEIDNPACLCYYSPIALHNPLVKRQIKKFCRNPQLKKILAISDAAKKGMLSILGEEFGGKIETIYPPATCGKKSGSLEKRVRFLFVGYDFYRKGGKEIVGALEQLKGNFEITFISPVPAELKARLQALEKMDVKIETHAERKKLLEEVMPNSDVILLPSHAESFGITAYEGISRGLAAIVSDVYALPEIVQDQRNGFVVHTPFKYFERNGLPNTKAWLIPEIDSYIKKQAYPEFQEQIRKAMQYYIDNPSELEKHKKESNRLFEEKFALKVRNRKLGKIMEMASGKRMGEEEP